jgi:hypothetical protein
MFRVIPTEVLVELAEAAYITIRPQRRKGAP